MRTFAIISLFLSFNAHSEELSALKLFELWKNFKTPSVGPVEVIGSTSAGCLKGAVELKQADFSQKKIPGYIIMKPSRSRYFAHPQLVQVVEEMGKYATAQKFAPVLVGDLSQARGGPFLVGHASHQNGIDADIRFDLPNHTLKKKEVESLGASSFVKNGEVTKSWTQKQTALLAWTSQNSEVDRIFVNPAIKKWLCKDSANHSWLQKIRPWWGHHDHFHVRLRCPAGMKLCQQQEILPAGSGCEGPDLEWWFTEEARLELEKRLKEKGPKEFPKLPAECQALTQ